MGRHGGLWGTPGGPLGRLWEAFGEPLGSLWAALGPQGASRVVQEVPNRCPRGPQEGPRGAQEAPKTLPRASKRPLGVSAEAKFRSNNRLQNRCCYLHHFRHDLGSFFIEFATMFCMVLRTLARRDQLLNKKLRHAFHLVIYESKRMSELTRAKQTS